MAKYRGAMAVVEMAITFPMMVNKKGQMMCSARSCFLSECQPLMVIAITHRMYGGAVLKSSANFSNQCLFDIYLHRQRRCPGELKACDDDGKEIGNRSSYVAHLEMSGGHRTTTRHETAYLETSTE
jgi:hypothetical protein